MSDKKSSGKGGAKKKDRLPSGLEKLPKKAYESELKRLQAELVEMQAPAQDGRYPKVSDPGGCHLAKRACGG